MATELCSWLQFPLEDMGLCVTVVNLWNKFNANRLQSTLKTRISFKYLSDSYFITVYNIVNNAITLYSFIYLMRWISGPNKLYSSFLKYSYCGIGQINTPSQDESLCGNFFFYTFNIASLASLICLANTWKQKQKQNKTKKPSKSK